ncbi:MAG: glycosyltransferase family 2 protein [Thermoguttaceae bacterium]|nr:glycosyltransferase family 2 protein [Thermoguttaceae bacterium]
MDKLKNQLSVFFTESPSGENHGGRNPVPVLLSIVSPAYNEEANIEKFCEKVSAVLESMNIPWEIVLVNDGSEDRSAEIMRQLHERDPRIKSVILARNFGNQIAISAGLRASQGKAVIVMDADLQQPPEMIPQMVELWKQGFHVVNTVRQSYGKNAGWLKKKTSALFYRFMNFVSEVRLEPNSSEFRLMDRVVVNVLAQMPERTQFLRGLIRWMGFRQTSIPCEINARFAGTPSFTPKKLMNLAVDGIVSFSTKPLRWVAYLGVFCMALLLPWLVFDVSRVVFAGGSWNLASILVPLNLLIGGAVLLSLGIIGEYIGRIYTETKRRPLFTVQEQYGLDGPDFACQSEIGHSWKSESSEQKVQVWSQTPDSPEMDEKSETANSAVSEPPAEPTDSSVSNASADSIGSGVSKVSAASMVSSDSMDSAVSADPAQNARSQDAA